MSRLSHSDRANRRREIAAYASAHGVARACHKFGVCQTTVYAAMSESGIEPARKPRAHEANRPIAEFAAKHGLDATIQKFNVSAGTIYGYCRAHGLKPATNANVNRRENQTFRILKALLAGGQTRMQIAAEFGITRQAVDSIADRATDAGFAITKKKATVTT